jgi:flagellin-like protein
MKGISPMIATVLIIAFTIAVGGIISIFMTNLTTTQTGEAERSAAGTSECAGSYIDVINVSADTSGRDNILIHNPSKNAIYVTSIYDDLGNVNTSTLVGGPQDRLLPGEIKGVSAINVPGANAKKLTLIGFCENTANTTNISISGTCPKGGSCWPK